MRWGENDSSGVRTLLIAVALLVLVCACLLSGMWDDAQARLAVRGSWCERIGASGGTDGTVAGW